MAEGLFANKVNRLKLENFKIESAGTSRYHIGQLPDSRMRETALQKGVELISRARQFKVEDFENFDLILAMDRSNFQDIVKITKDEKYKSKVHLMRDFDEKNPGSDVPDPYFGGQKGFEEVYNILDRSTQKLLDSILENGV
jgi:protein-tyrosine phosphatase